MAKPYLRERAGYAVTFDRKNQQVFVIWKRNCWSPSICKTTLSTELWERKRRRQFFPPCESGLRAPARKGRTSCSHRDTHTEEYLNTQEGAQSAAETLPVRQPRLADRRRAVRRGKGIRQARVRQRGTGGIRAGKGVYAGGTHRRVHGHLRHLQRPPHQSFLPRNGGFRAGRLLRGHLSAKPRNGAARDADVPDKNSVKRGRSRPKRAAPASSVMLRECSENAGTYPRFQGIFPSEIFKSACITPCSALEGTVLPIFSFRGG